MYTHLAHLYDWPGAEDFSGHLLQKTRDVFERHGLRPPGPVLDLACGTGLLTTKLAETGWQMTGLDLSGAMLEQARKRSTSPENPRWIQADMRDFHLDEPPAAVLCYYDSLNHLLTEEDLSRCLGAVYRNLPPGGGFFFDLNTPQTYRELWQGTDVYEGPNCRLHFQMRFDEATGRAAADISAEEHTEDGLRVTQDRVVEQYYPPETVGRLIERAGFGDIMYEEFTPIAVLPAGDPLKTFWQCRKDGALA